jgi:hypothetical protein
MKVYRIKRTFWKQDVMEFEDLLKVKELLKGRFKDFKANVQAFGALMDSLFDDVVLENLMAIVLRPYEPTVFHRWWNHYQCRRQGITRDHLIRHMTLPQIAKVGTDFFLLNLLWIDDWLDSPIDSGFQLNKQTPRQLMLLLSKFFTQFAVGISHALAISEDSLPKQSSPGDSSP